MPFLVDSDWLISYLAGEPEAVSLLSGLTGEGAAISILTYMESFQGVLRSPDPEGAEIQLAALLEEFPILPFSQPVARRCAGLREHLSSHGRRIHQRAIDLMIASTALHYDLVLVTRNSRDFRDIPGLLLHP